jgi:hypothetical protein
VHVCRYCGLNEEAVAAHHEARRLDPNVATSLDQTLLMAGDVEELVSAERPPVPGGADAGIRIMGLGLSGRREEARQALVAMRETMRLPAFQAWVAYLMAWIDRRPADMREHLAALSALRIQEDPEAVFLQGWLFCDAGAHDTGVAHLQRAAAKGYFPVATLARSPQFDALRNDPTFRAVQAAAEIGRQRSLTAFRDAGGERLLGRHSMSGAA